MKRLVKILGLLITVCAFACGQQTEREKSFGSNFLAGNAIPPIVSTDSTAQDQQAETKQDEEHLSKKEKKELKKRRKEEEKLRKKEAKKDEKHRKADAKKQEKEIREEQKREAKQQASEDKREMKKQNKEMAKAQKQENKRDQKEQAREIRQVEKQEARVASKEGAYTIPVSSRATPSLLRAQQEVARSIYSQMPNSHVIVLLNPANQLVLKGSAPSPSIKRRLLGLALSAAGGYGVVDQLAANLMGSAAGGVTNAAIGGVSDLIHGSGTHHDAGAAPYDQPGPPSDAAAGDYGPPSSNSPPAGNYGPPLPDGYSGSNSPSSDNRYAPNNGPSANDTSSNSLIMGSNACINIRNPQQVLLTGEAATRMDRSRLEQFAEQLAGTNATVLDQLATRSNGAQQNAVNPQGSPPDTILDASNLTGVITPGSVICVNADSNDSVVLAGTVASSAELASVEHRLQPLLGNARLLDQLTTGTLARSGSPEAVPAPASANSAASTGSDVEQALHSIPRLSDVDAQVGDTTVRLSGSVETREDEQVAREIAQQYAPGRSVVDAITVTGRQQAAQ